MPPLHFAADVGVTLLAQVADGRGQVVGIVGEPGMGESRLLYEFRHHLRSAPVSYIDSQCLSYGQTIPYFPVLDLLRHLCGLTDTDTSETLETKVQSTLQTAGLVASDWAPYLLHLLGVQRRMPSLSGRWRSPVRTKNVATRRMLCASSATLQHGVSLQNTSRPQPTTNKLSPWPTHLACARS